VKPTFKWISLPDPPDDSITLDDLGMTAKSQIRVTGRVIGGSVVKERAKTLVNQQVTVSYKDDKPDISGLLTKVTPKKLFLTVDGETKKLSIDDFGEIHPVDTEEQGQEAEDDDGAGTGLVEVETEAGAEAEAETEAEAEAETEAEVAEKVDVDALLAELAAVKAENQELKQLIAELKEAEGDPLDRMKVVDLKKYAAERNMVHLSKGNGLSADTIRDYERRTALVENEGTPEGLAAVVAELEAAHSNVARVKRVLR